MLQLLFQFAIDWIRLFLLVYYFLFLLWFISFRLISCDLFGLFSSWNYLFWIRSILQSFLLAVEICLPDAVSSFGVRLWEWSFLEWTSVSGHHCLGISSVFLASHFSIWLKDVIGLHFEIDILLVFLSYTIFDLHWFIGVLLLTHPRCFDELVVGITRWKTTTRMMFIFITLLLYLFKFLFLPEILSLVKCDIALFILHRSMTLSTALVDYLRLKRYLWNQGLVLQVVIRDCLLIYYFLVRRHSRNCYLLVWLGVLLQWDSIIHADWSDAARRSLLLFESWMLSACWFAITGFKLIGIIKCPYPNTSCSINDSLVEIKVLHRWLWQFVNLCWVLIFYRILWETVLVLIILAWFIKLQAVYFIVLEFLELRILFPMKDHAWLVSFEHLKSISWHR